MSGVRLDKWLWAARFFKTRAAAAEAVSGGKVHWNGGRTKPARALRPGDVLRVRRGPEEVEVVVRALAERRGPAAEAAALYEETEASRAVREAAVERRRLARTAAPVPVPGRPDKRRRRESMRFPDDRR